ncbi:MAG: hypothetical protein FWD60_08675, partial [Candidatus Azobacteroides sp.]|nr:hypothetical protein [Candidatus Azobacteroides sp.]
MNDNNLRSLYNNTRKLNPSFQVDYNTFASDMQDENNRKAFYSNLKSLNPKFQVDYDQFSKDMGFSSNNPQPSVSEKGYTRKIDERGDTTYIAPDVTISSDLPEDAKQKNVANSTTETQPSFNITIPDYASQIKTTEINPFKSKSLGEVIQDNFQKYASNPQNIFNVQFENFKNNPDLYRTGNEDYSKKRLTQEASNYLEGKRDDLKRTITDRAHGDVYDVVEKGKGAIPEEESNLVKDFLTNTEEGKAYVEFEKEQLKQLDDKIDALKSKISDSEKNSKKVIVSRFHIFPGSEGYFSADEVPENYKDIDEAKSQLAELEKYRNAVNDENKGFFSQFFNELGRRSDKAAVSLSTLGISKIMENKLWNDVLKNPDNKLTNEASQLLNQYQQMHSVDRSMAQDIAKGTADNIDYVEQFAVTGGAASAATKGTSVAIAEKLGGSIATKAIGDMGEGLAKAFVRTVLMPNTISNAYEQNINNPGSFLDSYANSFRQNLIQNFTETLGEHMPESLRFLPSKETKIGSIANSIAEHTGFQGLIPQMTEQEIVKVLNATSGDGNWSDLIDPRNQLITFGTIAAMQLPYSSISAAGYASGKFRNIKQKKSINKAYQENLNNINSVFGNESKELINDINNKLDSDNDGTSMFKLLIAVENSKEFTDSQKDAIAKYGLSYLAYSGLDKAKSEEIQQVQQKAVDAINRNINPDMNGIVKAKVAGTERQIIKGNISWNKDGSINEEQSSPQVYYKDDNGKIQIAPIAYVEKVTEHIPQENALDQAVNMKTNQMILQQANDEDPYVGKSVGFNDSGHAGTIKVNSLNEYGTYNIDIADNETGSSINSTITKQELQQLFEPTNSKENEAPATGKTNQMTGNNAVTYETKGSNADNPSEQKKASTVEEITARAPKQDNGEIDYKTLLNQSPEDYAILLENESTPEEVEKELSAHSKTLQKNIDKKSKKLEKESDPNKRKTIRDDIASDTKQKENIDAIIASRYWNKETTPTEANKEEVTPTEKPVSQEGENVNPETQKSSGKNFISKHEGHPLTRVENLGMGQNQAKGTYVSFEPKNRYETEHNKAKNVEISIQNPITFDQNQNDFAKFQQKTLENRYEDFKASDFSSINEGEVPTIDNLNEKGIDRLSGFVTEELQKQGHDGIVFDGDGEHEIVVFDKNNVRDKNVTQAEIKSNTGVKSKQRAKRTNLQTPRTELQKFIDNTAPANLYQATLLNLMSGGQLSRQHYFDATGYKTNDLGRLKFLLTDKGTPFDIFEQNYYSAYRPEEFNQGFDSNTDEIVQAINDY